MSYLSLFYLFSIDYHDIICFRPNCFDVTIFHLFCGDFNDYFPLSLLYFCAYMLILMSNRHILPLSSRLWMKGVIFTISFFCFVLFVWLLLFRCFCVVVLVCFVWVVFMHFFLLFLSFEAFPWPHLTWSYQMFFPLSF